MKLLLFRFLRITGWSVLTFIISLFITGIMFINLSRQFGKDPSDEKKSQYEKSANFKDGKFQNPIPTSMDMDFWKAIKMLPKFFAGTPNSRPDFDLPIIKLDSLDLVNLPNPTQLFWFGHSAFLLQLDGKNILLDPMFGEVPAPHPFLGRRRYSKDLPIEVEQLPEIDLVLFSHDHYDHLDYESIQKLKSKTNMFLVPLGVGSHLEHWGVEPSKIKELDWWEEISQEELFFAFTPSRHFSGRGLGNRFSTLWGSWVIKSENKTIYFSGDSGYGPHFSEIGEKYGPFDFAMMECGQYNENWKEIHMMPEETAQAGIDIRAKTIMPIHWGAFTLAMHSWTDPVERVLAKSKELNLPVIVPKIGQPIEFKENNLPQETWWINP